MPNGLPTFLVAIGTAERVQLAVEQLAALVASRDPSRTWRTEQLASGAPESCLLSAEGVDFLLVIRREPPDLALLDEPIRKSVLNWPEARDGVGAAVEQIVIAPTSPAADHAAAVKAAFLATIAAAALIDAASGRYVFWGTAGLLVSPTEFVRSASRMVEEREPPILCWVCFDIFRGTTGAPVTAGMRSVGLAAFVGYEVELQPLSAPPVEIARRAVGVAEMLLREGTPPVLDDLPGPREGERIQLSWWTRGEVKVLNLQAAGEGAP